MGHRAETAAYADYSRAVSRADVGDDALVYVMLKDDPVADEGDYPLGDSAVVSLVFFEIHTEPQPAESLAKVVLVPVHKFGRQLYEKLFGL